MPNARRGEIEAELGGATRRLVLTLGALAELESHFEAQDLVDLAERFGTGRLSAGDLVAVIGAGLRGAGESISDREVAALTAAGGAASYARIVSDLLTVTFGAGSAGEGAAAAPFGPAPPAGASPSPFRGTT
ncbi:gene transfer agent family protein [Phreatobacter sp. HK31-P]